MVASEATRTAFEKLLGTILIRVGNILEKMNEIRRLNHPSYSSSNEKSSENDSFSTKPELIEECQSCQLTLELRMTS